MSRKRRSLLRNRGGNPENDPYLEQLQELTWEKLENIKLDLEKINRRMRTVKATSKGIITNAISLIEVAQCSLKTVVKEEEEHRGLR